MKRTPLRRKAPLASSPPRRGGGPKAAPARRRRMPTGKPLAPGTARLKRGPIRPVSATRRAENAERRRVVAATFGTAPACERCGRRADDVHERVPRSLLGSITDPANLHAVCRGCHSWIHANPAAAKAEGWLASA